MCGIVGFLDKTGNNADTLGRTVLGMLNALGCRGPDSAGVALYATRPGSTNSSRKWLLGGGQSFDASASKVLEAAGKFAPVSDSSITDCYLRFQIGGQACIQCLIERWNRLSRGLKS